ncbi:nuclear RNA export factor 1-like [Prorops nasuta]|uniref:nuclear RNA export factor 1-like n=1 Tax=Prorops nasuta TaxID=863751 RepID=UPI0034CDD522
MTSLGPKENNAILEPIRLSYVKPFFGKSELSLATRQDLWHKFILFNSGQYSKDELLSVIIASCEPEALLPVEYKVDSQNTVTFLAKCCTYAIENFVRQGLSITFPDRKVIYFDIILGFTDIKSLPLTLNRVVSQALHLRYDGVKKILNLDNFKNERALRPIFCPLSIPKILQYVLRCCKLCIFNSNNRETRLPIRELSLKYNDLSSVVLYEKVFSFHLTKLDLRFNNINDVKTLKFFSEFKITELYLDGNPLCAMYEKSQDYITDVKHVFPQLQKLDGVVIGVEKKYVPTSKDNFLMDGSKISLIKQFLKHFFTLYDQDDRVIMNGLYEKNALYSITLGNITNYAQKQITKNFYVNRNLLKFVDYAKCNEYLFQGPEQIISILRRQPATIHNYKLFQVDLLYDGQYHIAFSVQGSFFLKNVSCPPFVFNRTFILLKKEDNEFCIVNDQQYVESSANNSLTNHQTKVDCRISTKFIPTVFSRSEKEQLLTLLQGLTTMNRAICEEYLKIANWDIRAAINTFTKSYMNNDISVKAFHEDESSTHNRRVC